LPLQELDKGGAAGRYDVISGGGKTGQGQETLPSSEGSGLQAAKQSFDKGKIASLPFHRQGGRGGAPHRDGRRNSWKQGGVECSPRNEGLFNRPEGVTADGAEGGHALFNRAGEVESGKKGHGFARLGGGRELQQVRVYFMQLVWSEGGG